MGINPENYTVEGADISLQSQATQAAESAYAVWPSGGVAHIESPGTAVEQERPRGNRRLVPAGPAVQRRSEAVSKSEASPIAAL